MKTYQPSKLVRKRYGFRSKMKNKGGKSCPRSETEKLTFNEYKIVSLKNEILNHFWEKKYQISNYFLNKLSGKSNKIKISFVLKKLGNAVKRNKIKRRLRNIMNQIKKIYKINLNYSYLLIAKKEIINAKFSDIKKTIFKDYKKIK